MDQSIERRGTAPLRDQLQVLVPLVPVWAVGFGIIALVALGNGRQVNALMMDPNFTGGFRWYTGLISNLGILCWTVAAASACWGAWLARLGGRAGAAKFLVASAALTLYLLLDDLLQLHADLLPRTTGVPKKGIEALISVAAVVWIMANRPEIRRTRVALLGVAGGLLLLKMGLDAHPLSSSVRLALLEEDGTKLLGVLSWATYFVMTARDIGRSIYNEARSAPDGSKRDRDRDAPLSSLSGPG
jgi:hypothetical protein